MTLALFATRIAPNRCACSWDPEDIAATGEARCCTSIEALPSSFVLYARAMRPPRADSVGEPRARVSECHR